ncbi:hypothetical protein FB385_0547 [Paramicrobacterium agarici]|nr:hypothetical protein FB385_0547 [Microbacterium agarici]
MSHMCADDAQQLARFFRMVEVGAAFAEKL